MLTDTFLLARRDSPAAVAQLLEGHHGLCRYIASEYYAPGLDADDLIQEAQIGLSKAIRDFNPDAHVTFRHFASLCIRRNVISAIKSAQRYKHAPLNSAQSLSKPVGPGDGDMTLEDLVPASVISDPVEQLIATEGLATVIAVLATQLSELESQSLSMFLAGEPYIAIAEQLELTPKVVDNALQRVRRKVADCLGWQSRRVSPRVGEITRSCDACGDPFTFTGTASNGRSLCDRCKALKIPARRELFEQRVARYAESRRRPGHDTTVRIRFVDPATLRPPEPTEEEKMQQAAIRRANILRTIRDHGEAISRKDLAAQMGMPAKQLSADLRDLVTDAQLIATGETKARRFAVPEMLMPLRGVVDSESDLAKPGITAEDVDALNDEADAVDAERESERIQAEEESEPPVELRDEGLPPGERILKVLTEADGIPVPTVALLEGAGVSLAIGDVELDQLMHSGQVVKVTLDYGRTGYRLAVGEPRLVIDDGLDPGTIVGTGDARVINTDDLIASGDAWQCLFCGGRTLSASHFCAVCGRSRSTSEPPTRATPDYSVPDADPPAGQEYAPPEDDPQDPENGRTAENRLAEDRLYVDHDGPRPLELDDPPKVYNPIPELVWEDLSPPPPLRAAAEGTVPPAAGEHWRTEAWTPMRPLISRVDYVNVPADAARQLLKAMLQDDRLLTHLDALSALSALEALDDLERAGWRLIPPAVPDAEPAPEHHPV